MLFDEAGGPTTRHPADLHRINIDTGSLAAGVYILQIRNGSSWDAAQVVVAR